MFVHKILMNTRNFLMTRKINFITLKVPKLMRCDGSE